MSCLSNMRQMGIGLGMYVNDADEMFPMPQWNITGGASMPADVQSNFAVLNYAKIWADLIQPYMKNARVEMCPSDDTLMTTGPNKGNASFKQTGDPIAYALSFYAYNYAKTGAFKAVAAGGGPTLAEVPNPAGHIILMEARADQGYAGSGLWNFRRCNFTGPTNMPQGGLYRHQNGANYVFFDGHAKYKMADPVWEQKEPYCTTGVSGGFNWQITSNIENFAPDFAAWKP